MSRKTPKNFWPKNIFVNKGTQAWFLRQVDGFQSNSHSIHQVFLFSRFFYFSSMSWHFLDDNFSYENWDDWEFTRDNISSNLRQLRLDNYHIAILTNQRNLSYKQQIATKGYLLIISRLFTHCLELLQKIDDIVEQLQLPAISIFISPSDGIYRKPMSGIFERFFHDVDRSKAP